MAFNHTLSAILRGRWMIDKQFAISQLPLIVTMLGGNVPIAESSVQRTGNAAFEQPFVIDAATMDRYDLYNWDYQKERYVPNTNIPPNSVGVLPLNGPLTKYNANCGEPGMIQRDSWLQQMNRSNNIGSIVLLSDTPGGESRAAQTFSSSLKNSNKPTLCLVDDMCASLGMWFSSVCNETYLAHDLASMGSIGSYCMFPDFSGYFEKAGIKIHEIYAPQSTDKNKPFNDALKGDYAAIEDELRLSVNQFIKHVATNRGDKAAANQAAWNSGKMFTGQDAVKIGLADGIKPMGEVIGKAAWLGKRNKN